MPIKTSWNLWLVAVPVLSLVLITIQWLSVRRMEKALESSSSAQRVMEQYILSSFNPELSYSERFFLESCQPVLNDSSCLFYVPQSLCRACFSSLFFAFEDLSISGKSLLAIRDSNDPEVMAECSSRGIRCIAAPFSIDAEDNIILARKTEDGAIRVMSFTVGLEPILHMFFTK